MPSCGFSLAVSGMMMPPFFDFLLFDSFHEDAVAERFDVQCHTFVFCLVVVDCLINSRSALAAGKFFILKPRTTRTTRKFLVRVFRVFRG